ITDLQFITRVQQIVRLQGIRKQQIEHLAIFVVSNGFFGKLNRFNRSSKKPIALHSPTVAKPVWGFEIAFYRKTIVITQHQSMPDAAPKKVIVVPATLNPEII